MALDNLDYSAGSLTNTHKEQIRKFVYENFLFNDFNRQLSDDDSFISNGIIDSTGVLELVSFIEELFKITILDDELVPDNLDSINQLANFVNTKIN